MIFSKMIFKNMFLQKYVFFVIKASG